MIRLIEKVRWWFISSVYVVVPQPDSLNVPGSHRAFEKGSYGAEEPEDSVGLPQARNEQVQHGLHSKREVDVNA